MKVFQAYYKYTETYCSPYESEWEDVEVVLVSTLDESLAQEFADKHNTEKKEYSWSKKYAKVRSFELTSR